MLHLGVIICANLKVKISVCFAINMFSFILNIVSTKPKHKHENRKIDFDAFYLQEIKKWGSLFMSTFPEVKKSLYMIILYLKYIWCDTTCNYNYLVTLIFFCVSEPYTFSNRCMHRCLICGSTVSFFTESLHRC